MKTHHLSNLVVVLVLIAALAGLYFIFNGVGRAIAFTEVETIRDCCCTGERGIFEVSSGKTFTDLTIADCAKTCSESSTPAHPVTSMGMC